MQSKEIVELANNLISKWKKLLKSKTNGEHKIPPTIPPKKDFQPITKSTSTDSIPELEDKSIEPFRNNMKRMICSPFLKHLPKGFTEQNVYEKVKGIELEMFTKLNKSQYIQKGKAITSNISDAKNEEFRINILNGTYTPEKLVSMDSSEMANKDLKKEILQITNNALDALRSDWDDKHAPAFEGLHKCEKCGGSRTTSREIQMRCADEPMTIFIRCIDCGNEWKIG